jgi:hypothetical protein
MQEMVMSKIKRILKESLNTSYDGGGDGAASQHPDAPGQLYKPGLSMKQKEKKLHADYRAYKDNQEVGGHHAKEYEDWLKGKKPMNDKQNFKEGKIKKVLESAISEANGMGFGSQQDALAHADEVLRNIQQELEREVEWPLTDYIQPQKVKQMLSPIHQGVASAINAIGQEMEAGQHESASPANISGKEHAMEMVSRLRELSGLTPLANSTSVAGKPVAESDVFNEGNGIGLGHQRMLDQGYAQCETQIMRAAGMIKQYARKVDSMAADMNDDEQAHYQYSIRGLLDILEDELKDLQKLG